jgi:hypothetical protein
MIIENLALLYLLNTNKTNIEACPRNPELGCIPILKEEKPTEGKPIRGTGR